MQKVHIRSYLANYTHLSHAFNQALKDDAKLTWSRDEASDQLRLKQLMALLMEGVDFVLLPQSVLPYPLPKQVSIKGTFVNEEDESDPIFLVLLNTGKCHVFNSIGSDLSHQQGQVHIAGFGPGNPELLTIKAHRLIQEADIIYYDDLLDNSYLDQVNAEKVYVGKRKGKHSAKQEDINQLLYVSAMEGKKVLRLKGGDPLVFGRGGEEFHYLNRRLVKTEIVPGVTSALAAAADAVVPLTSRGTSTSVAFTLGHDAVYNKLPNADTLVFYMGASQQRKWAQRLIDVGWAANTPVVAVRNASLSTSEHKYYTLNQLLDSELTLAAPALLIVGQTASENAEAQNQKWLYTGTNVNYFKGDGIVVHNPMVGIESQGITEEGQAVLSNLLAFDRIVFASPFAVRHFFNALKSTSMDVRAIANHQINSIGASTSAELKQYGLLIEPETISGSAEGLLTSFINKGISNESMLLPCSNKGLSILPEGLKKLGNYCFQLKLYKATLPENVVRHNLDDFYGIVFSSPTAVHHFFQLHKVLPPSLKIVARGRFTRDLVKQYLQELSLVDVVKVTEELIA